MYVWFSITSSEHTLKYTALTSSLTLSSWGPLTSGVTLHVSSSSGQVPALFNKAFTGSNLHLDFLRKLQLSHVWKMVYLDLERTHALNQNRKQHSIINSTHAMGQYSSSWFIYISSSLSFRGLRLDCAARLRLGLGLENLLLFSATITWAEMEAESVSFTSWCWETLSSRTPLEEPSSSRPSLCSPTCVSHQQSLLWLLHE